MIRYCYGKSRKRLYIAHEIQGRSMKKNLMNYLYVLLFVVTAIELNARSYYFKSYEVEDGLSNNNVTCCVQDHYGFMWFGTRDGLNRFDGNKFHIIKNQTKQRGTLISSWITDLAISPSGELWVGTNMGVQKYDYQTDTFSLIKFTKGIGCTYLEFDHQGNLWMLLSGFSLIKYNEQSELHQNYLYKDSDPITSFYITPQDQIWGTTLNGNVVLLDPTDNKFIPLNIHNGSDTLHIDNMTTLWASPSDNTLLIGTSDNGVKQVNIQTGVCRNVLTQQKNSPLYTRDIFQVTNDEVWIATYNGIYIYQIKNNLWFATGNGVKMYDRNLKSTTKYTTQDGLPSNVIYRIEEDPKGHMWISTTNGLAVLNPVNQEIKVFKKEHGLLSNQFNYNSSLKAKDGKLYFGTLKGLVRFHPDNIQQFSIQPKIYMTQINYSDPDHNLLRQKDITFKKGITLEHNQSTFYIDYTSLSYQAPNLTQYAYCMEGLSSKWYHVVGENRVYFTKLPPGNYTFKVKAANLSGIWNDEPAMFQITILPPWWLSTKALILYGIIAIGCVVLLIFIISRHNKANIQQKIQEFENEKEKELYQAKIDFFINIAHEIRTPLTLIKSPLEKVTRDIKLSPSAKNYLTIVDKNANRLLDLVNQLLDFRKTEIEGYKLNFIHTDIIALMQETFERFHDTAEQEALQMIIECNVKSFYAFIDKEACTKILSNLLSNAIKYARSKIIVRFEAQDGERFTIDIMNDGKPISEEIKEKIFEPFYRDDSSIHKSGTGLGLPLARSLAEMHEGSLTLEESPAGLIIFRLRLPVNQPNSLKLEEEKAEVLTNPASERKYVTQESRPTVLVVEDNTEMLHFIGQEINVHYNVVTAGNGEEAIARLQEYGIQLIISDIMMPVMDGFTLLKKIKTNLEFSHIPIILLTAKNTLQSRMEGLELGADAYIDKPFSMDLLLTQVTNLLNNRSNMRAYYFNSPIANIKSMAYTKADEKFLKKLNDIIDSHINDVNLDVDMIADLMNLSRPTLYRKINGLSNVTPNELIKISRLKKAAELILQGDMRIYEIAEAVGFNSQSYFSRAFSKQFNMSPSQYAKENNIELK